MLKILKCARKVNYGFQKAIVQKRWFLSEAYRCEEAWQARLQSSVLQGINTSNLFLQLEQKQSTAKQVSAIDVDIFANAVVDKAQVEELLSLVHNLRLTAETSNTLESTHHAVIRYLLHHNCTEDIMTVLHDRLNYGIFPDYVCYNILMDTYIKKKEYGNAARIAVLPMLQEDSQHPITNALSVYSCHKYLENPNDWQNQAPETDDSTEEIKVRVTYIRNPFFDDHFDLTDPCDLVGKTLAFYGKIMNNTLGRTYQLRGLILYRKYEDVSKIIQQWLNTINENIVYEEVFDLIKKDNEHIAKEQVTDEFKNIMPLLDKLKNAKLSKDSLNEAVENEVKLAIDKQSEADIAEQLKNYTHWVNQRKIILQNQLDQANREKRINFTNKLKMELERRERLLTFFENEENIELEIEKMEKRDKHDLDSVLRTHYGERKLRKLEKEQEYVPPQIKQNI